MDITDPKSVKTEIETIAARAIEVVRASVAEAAETGAPQVVALATLHGAARLSVTLDMDYADGCADIGPAKLVVRAVGVPVKDAFGGACIDPRQPELL